MVELTGRFYSVCSERRRLSAVFFVWDVLLFVRGNGKEKKDFKVSICDADKKSLKKYLIFFNATPCLSPFCHLSVAILLSIERDVCPFNRKKEFL